MINETISHYKIIKLLGRGGMGEVYLAEDLNLARQVALKFLSKEHASKPEFKTRFKREAQAAALIGHPNVVTIHDINVDGDLPYIVMEYIAGENLNDLIQQRELQLDEILDITIQACAGLGKAHRQGILHRDIKPANILLDTDNRVIIVDFGLAKLRDASNLTVAGTMMGTIPYMSPEQIKNKELDQRSDIFSLGVVLYELITRCLPFQGKTWEAIRDMIIKHEPEPLARYKRDVSHGLQNIVDKALDKNREIRYPNVESLKVDLKREQKALAVSPKPKKSLSQTNLNNLTMTAVSHSDIVEKELVTRSPVQPKDNKRRKLLWSIFLICTILLVVYAIVEFLPSTLSMLFCHIYIVIFSLHLPMKGGCLQCLKSILYA